MGKRKMLTLARKGVRDVPVWPAGRPVEELQAELGLEELAMMASNENPIGPSPKAMEAVRRELGRVHLYPDGSCAALRRALGQRLGVGAEQIVVGNGGDNCLRMIGAAFVEEGDEVLMGDPTFPVYGMTTRIMGGQPVRVPLREYCHDLHSMGQRLSPRTKLVFVGNPNNPTGTIVHRADLQQLLRKLPDSALLVLDEAYFEFVADPDYPNGLEYVRAGANVIVLRTFSKLYGLAGLRVGYLVARREIAEILVRVREPYTVSRVAQAAALAALEDGEFRSRVLSENASSMEFLHRELGRLGLPHAPSHTNFLFVDLGRDAAEVADRLLARGFLIRTGAAWNLPTWARITAGTMEQNRRFVQALEEILGGDGRLGG
jgi:histidinol-phosphate aminotransferase